MNWKKWILAFAAFSLLCATAFFFVKPPAPAPIQLPNPNGYDDLVKAGQMFVGELPECYWSDLDDECLEKTRAWLKANSEVLKMVRLGLSRESRVSIVPTRAYFSRHLDELACLKRLAQTLGAEGKVAEMDNRIDDAIQSYLNAARLHEKMRGGVMIDSLVGIAVEAIGVNALRKLSDTMTQAQRERLIKDLVGLYSDRDSFKEIMEKEKSFAGLLSLQERFASLFTFRATRKAYKKCETKLKFRRSHLGLFLVDLAVRNFEGDNGVPPETLQELVPKYLPFLPKDDFSGLDFIYRPGTNGYELYGVGADGKDDNGKPLVQKGMESPGDMLPISQY